MESDATDIDMATSESPPPIPPFTGPFTFPIGELPANTRFAMGRATPRRNRLNQRRERSTHEKRKVPKKVKPTSKSFCWPAFPLSIHKSYGLSINLILGGFPRSSVKAVLHFQALIAPPEKPNIFSLKPDDILKVSAAFSENLKARWSFRKLILYWRLKRCRKINEVDPMTMETIKQPVEMYDLYNKAIYTFEAKSLARAWRSNLLNHDGVFPEPKFPVNPFTNLKLQMFQLHISFKSIRQAGHMDWVLDSFYSCKYNLEEWNKKFSIPLKVESLTSILADKSCFDRFDLAMDFAEMQHEIHGIDFPKKMFEWIFSKHEVDEYAEVWIRACKKYYVEKYTITDKDDLEDLDVRSSILNAYLVEVPTIVKVMYTKYLDRTQTNGRRRVQNVILVRRGGGNL